MTVLSVETIDAVLAIAARPGVKRLQDLRDLLLDERLALAARDVALLEAQVNPHES